MVDQSVVDALNGAGLLPMAFQTVTAIAVMVCYFMMNRIIREFDALKEEHKKLSTRCPITHSKADLELASFKVFAEREYAKANTLSRIHSRIDDVFKLLAEMKENNP